MAAAEVVAQKGITHRFTRQLLYLVQENLMLGMHLINMFVNRECFVIWALEGFQLTQHPSHAAYTVLYLLLNLEA
jgi:hypothetical protein